MSFDLDVAIAGFVLVYAGVVGAAIGIRFLAEHVAVNAERTTSPGKLVVSSAVVASSAIAISVTEDSGGERHRTPASEESTSAQLWASDRPSLLTTQGSGPRDDPARPRSRSAVQPWA